MELTPKQEASIAQWNSFGLDITETSMKTYMDSWFSNMRSLIGSHFTLHSVEELVSQLSDFKTFTILGSGPSVPKIAPLLPQPHEAIFCGPTCLGALTRDGIRPTALIVADSSPDQYQHVVESELLLPNILDVVLPITADPLWYNEASILNRSHLYFYLPYMDFMGDIDIGFNHILKSLFPEVNRWIAQAGNVANTMLNVADMCCGEFIDKRIYIGVDNSWIKGEPPRAPLRFDPSQHSKALQTFWENNTRPRTDIIALPFHGKVIHTDLVSLGYAINLFYIIHSWERDRPYAKNRYALISQASSLYQAASPDLSIPIVYPEDTAQDGISPDKEDSWAYKVLLGLVELSNSLNDRLKTEEKDAQIKASMAARLVEGPEGDSGSLLQS